MKSYIGVFDSGIGGLTCVKELIKKIPKENIIFLADNKNVPYGSKSKEEVRILTLNGVYFLNRFDLKAMIVACNTSEANSLDLVEENVNVPVYGVITPAVKAAVKATKNKKIGLFATSLTVRSNRYQEILDELSKDIRLYQIECPKLVPMIEEGRFEDDDQEMIETIREYMEPLLKEGIDTLILGCTHYDVLLEMISRMYPDLNVVSSSRCVVDVVLNELNIREYKEPERKYFTTSLDERFDKVSKKIIKDCEFEKVDV